MRVALSIMLMQECCNFICQWGNEPGGVPIRIKHLLHSSAVRYGEIFYSPSAREISHADSGNKSYIKWHKIHCCCCCCCCCLQGWLWYNVRFAGLWRCSFGHLVSWSSRSAIVLLCVMKCIMREWNPWMKYFKVTLSIVGELGVYVNVYSSARTCP